jgi:hypothetical protein
MLKLCDRCIHALQSRGETVLVGYAIDDSIGENCSWCEKSDTDLYMAMLEPFGCDYKVI